MNTYEAGQSLSRIFSLQNFMELDRIPYVQTVMDSCGWMDAKRFDCVVKELCSELKGNVHLKPGHYIEKYRELAKNHDWESKREVKCATCNGDLFIMSWVQSMASGQKLRIASPCLSCNSKYKAKVNLDFVLCEALEPALAKPEWEIE